MNNKPIIALMYDFDKTLSPKDMQEFSFIPDLGITNPNEFWTESNKLASDSDMSGINAYMYLMLKKARAEDISIKRDAFVKLGKEVELFKGVKTWFDRINTYAREKGATTEHYIISSGLKEIVEGTPIAKYFCQIYASSYYYNVDNIAVWPAQSVDYTAKTQYLFRINKGYLDVNDFSVNDYVIEDDRRVPFRNMIYIGDGFTDVPCMKLVKTYGGKSIVVYKPNSKTETAKKLINDNRADFMTSADYSKGKSLEKIVFNIVDSMVSQDKLCKAHKSSLAKAKSNK
jgi:hypothetical protein